MQITKCNRCGAVAENGPGYSKHPQYEAVKLIGLDDGRDIELCAKCKIECKDHQARVRELTVLMNQQFMSKKP